VALVGSLRDLSLPELLAIISNGEKSGIITIRSDAATAQIHVDEGRIVLASDTLRDERFGEIMMKLGKISQDTLTTALEVQETSGGSRRLGSILVEMGAITTADQDAAILYQSCEALYDLCTWQVGYFQFDAQEIPERSGISIQSTRSSRKWTGGSWPASGRGWNPSVHPPTPLCVDGARSRPTSWSFCG